MEEITRIIDAAAGGDRDAAEQILPAVYDELRRLAAWRLGNEAAPVTLQATEIVHEAYFRLAPGEHRWDGRRHFFAAAAESMRRILVDRARRRKAVRHGGKMHRTELHEERIVAPSENDDEMLAVHEALDELAETAPRQSELVKLRYFVGMTIEEAATVLNVSTPTAKRDWAFARAWLHRELSAKR